MLECVFILWKETLEGSKTETSPIVILLLPPHRAAQLKEHCDATKRILPAFALTLLYV